MTKQQNPKTAPRKKANAPASVVARVATDDAPPPYADTKLATARARAPSSVAKTARRTAKSTLKAISSEVSEQPPASPDIAAFQIYFDLAHRAHLDTAFVPLDNQGAQDPLLEFAVLERLAGDAQVRKAPYWGAVSWRFAEKTGLQGQAYLHEIRANPGFDVYFCNPYPENEGLYASPWQQAFAKHPGFRLLAAQVLAAAGHDPAAMDDIVPSARFSACNFFIGNARFWDSYVPFIRNAVDKARQTLPAAVIESLDSHGADPHGLHAGASYWPFIVERLFTLYLLKHQQQIKSFKIKLQGPESKLNVHVKRLREMKDVSHHTKSQWLCSCWLQYRNLFLLQVAGKEWCRLHLQEITPQKIRFD